jgi:hypothetical protein
VNELRVSRAPGRKISWPLALVPLSFRRHRIDEGVGLGIRIGAGVLAAVVVGSVLGAISRGLMALVALSAEGASSFTWTGSAFVLLIYALAMVPGGVVAGMTQHSLRWLLPVAGALFLCVPAIGVASEEIGSTVGFGALEWLGVGVCGAAIFLTIALAPLLTVRLTDRWLGRRDAAVPVENLPSPALR